MPEWYIQRIERFKDEPRDLDDKHKFYFQPHPETWDTFRLEDGKRIKSRVNRIRNIVENSSRTINEEIIVTSKRTSFDSGKTDGTGSFARIIFEDKNVIFFPDEFVKNYGIREGEYVDLVLLELFNKYNEQDGQEIYPKGMIKGIIQINPSSSESSSSRIIENLVDPVIACE